MPVFRRLKKEQRDARMNPLSGVITAPTDDPIQWKGVVVGPENSPYENGVYLLDIRIPEQYPFKPPKVKFLTKVYHPNIDSEGRISLDILTDKWSPALSIEKTLLSISMLLLDPNFVDTLVPEIGSQYRQDSEKFLKTAREWNAKYALKKK
eukprot:TRINITY_DN8947_c0_g1_i2.p1 TRINITY_DN8947_c0_g1~~TRINITY_DN8947_c0_g1_i2.p1  ORF type:complete len:171 (+),score=26.45 TRINITY_DN8947_c0_g1_i2:63-515(+)